MKAFTWILVVCKSSLYFKGGKLILEADNPSCPHSGYRPFRNKWDIHLMSRYSLFHVLFSRLICPCEDTFCFCFEPNSDNEYFFYRVESWVGFRRRTRLPTHTDFEIHVHNCRRFSSFRFNGSETHLRAKVTLSLSIQPLKTGWQFYYYLLK